MLNNKLNVHGGFTLSIRPLKMRYHMDKYIATRAGQAGEKR